MDINFFFIQFAIFLYRYHLKWDIQRTVTDLVQCFGVIDTCIEQIPKFKLSVILLFFFSSYCYYAYNLMMTKNTEEHVYNLFVDTVCLVQVLQNFYQKRRKCFSI